MSAFIYLITNTVNSKQYVGKTKRPIQARFKQHLATAKGASTYHLYRAIRKHTSDAFAIELLEETTIELAASREIFYIATLKPEYNMTKGGEGCALIAPRMWITNGIEDRRMLKSEQIPEGFRRGIRDSRKVKMAGRTHSNETKLKMADSRKKMLAENPYSEETCEKMSVYAKNRPIEHLVKIGDASRNRSAETLAKIAFAAKNRSQETLAKMSTSQKGKIVSDTTKAKLSAILKGKPKSETWKANMRESWAKRKALKVSPVQLSVVG
jgi:group I intron endonuclease